MLRPESRPLLYAVAAIVAALAAIAFDGLPVVGRAARCRAIRSAISSPRASPERTRLVLE